MILGPARNFVFTRKALVVLALALSAVAFAQSHKLSRDLQSKSRSGQVDVIVQFNRPLSADLHARVTRRGGSLKGELPLVGAGAYTVPASALDDLAADPDVAYVSPDRPLRSTAGGGGVWANDYHTDSVNAAAAWALGLDGSGIGIAVIDSGISAGSDLNVKNIVYNLDLTPGKGSAADQYGHGTHVAGIIAGNGSSSSGNQAYYTFRGIAPNANLINLRVLDANGEGTESQVIAAINTAIALKSQYNIRVINLSLGRDVFESYTVDPLCRAVEQAWNAGIVVVVAAGNEGRDSSVGNGGYGTITAPGNDPFVITVGAMNTRGVRDRTGVVPTSYTSRGPTAIDHILKPDLVAPGNLVVSLYSKSSTLDQAGPDHEVLRSLYQTNGGADNPSNAYFVLSGTSMAAPMVSGSVALMIQQNPALTPDEVKARLMESAYKNLVPYSTAVDQSTGQSFSLASDMFTVGAGYLDIAAALANQDISLAAPGSAQSPTVAANPNGRLFLVNGTSAMWGSSAMWGCSAMWGSVLRADDGAVYNVDNVPAASAAAAGSTSTATPAAAATALGDTAQ